MTMPILAICVRMCQIDIYWGLGIGDWGLRIGDWGLGLGIGEWGLENKVIIRT
ncbi:MAG: hypothetical protein V7K67_11825 [Nostoc sp.]|uniref:hypothetical protein n=1 Tax=Nostoc sp. TaxID=1180 RepID=UPI002FF83863